MKILKIGDLHFGVKNDCPWMQNAQRQFINQAIDYSVKHGIAQWIQTGDWFDVRKAISHKTMEFNREMVELIENAGIHVDVIVGNHDMHFKNRIHPNACTEILTQYKNFRVFAEPTTVDYDGFDIDLIPWICDENEAQIMDFIANSNSTHCVGHFELVGFYFYKGIKSHGSDPAFLRKYKQVISGHYHTESENKNVIYIGTPYTITSGDEDDIRGFRVFDTTTETYEFVANNTTWHKRIMYPTTEKPESFRGLSVRMFVNEIDAKFSKFETALESVVHELRVVTKTHKSSEENNVGGVAEEETDGSIATIPDLMGEYVTLLPELSEDDKKSVIEMSNKLYMEQIK